MDGLGSKLHGGFMAGIAASNRTVISAAAQFYFAFYSRIHTADNALVDFKLRLISFGRPLYARSRLPCRHWCMITSYVHRYNGGHVATHWPQSLQ
eukprot:scaffold33438_cov28-Prasinocladus_malaysianus.AAC.1